jgi:hypothetical protein
MEQLSEIFKGLNLGSVLSDSAQPARDYNKIAKNVYKPESARFKLAVWFKDGNTRYFHSYDNKHDQGGAVYCDEYESLLKLLRMVHKFSGTYKNAIIYATLNPLKATALKGYDTEIIKFDMYGNKKTNNAANFLNEGKNIYLDLKRLNAYSLKKIK